jgi:hypothetical protein|tara:strand:+ start:368 stop:592 length:225 start_codon:yes stop_codon:yes gene_type:complete
MAKKSKTEMYRELGRKGGSSADFKALYFKLKSKEGIKDPLPVGPNLEDVLKRYGNKDGGLIKKGTPKLATKGWK